MCEILCLFLQASVVQTLDSAIQRINPYPADSLISLILIRWIAIYSVDSTIQRLNNQGQLYKNN